MPRDDPVLGHIMATKINSSFNAVDVDFWIAGRNKINRQVKSAHFRILQYFDF